MSRPMDELQQLLKNMHLRRMAERLTVGRWPRPAHPAAAATILPSRLRARRLTSGPLLVSIGG